MQLIQIISLRGHYLSSASLPRTDPFYRAQLAKRTDNSKFTSQRSVPYKEMNVHTKYGPTKVLGGLALRVTSCADKVLGEKVLRTTLRKATTKIVGRKSLINSAYVLANFVRNQGQTAELMSARLGFACFSTRLHAAWQATASPLLPETVTSKKKHRRYCTCSKAAS